MTFVTRQIDLTLTLADGQLNDQGDNSVSLKGLRCDVLISNVSSGLSLSNAQLRVYGMNMADMQKFNTIARNVLRQRNDEISIAAGDEMTGVREMFAGTISYANVNLYAAPNVCMDVFASPGRYYQMLPAAANTYPGRSDVATIIQALAVRMGFSFENHGVTAQLSDHYLHGTLIDQLWDVANAAGIICSIENRVIRIWPNKGALNDPLIEVSPSTGLIGYPTFTPVGLRVEMEFRNDVTVGRRMKLTSSLPQATGEWYINNMQHELSTQAPDGPWRTVALISKEGLARAN